MSRKWTGLERPITLADAEAELDRDRLFGPGYDARRRALMGDGPSGVDRANYRPWKKPRMERKKAAR